MICPYCNIYDYNEDYIYRDRLCVITGDLSGMTVIYRNCRTPNANNRDWIGLQLKIQALKVFGVNYTTRIYTDGHFRIEAIPKRGAKIIGRLKYGQTKEV